jgi:hypothetical protein
MGGLKMKYLDKEILMDMLQGEFYEQIIDIEFGGYGINIRFAEDVEYGLNTRPED